jgi:bifunctional non-homologous end joining protein LigD
MSTYDRKRDFAVTPEPAGGQPGADVDPLSVPVGNRFVIGQHHATALHHDLRLEMFNGETPVLVSWAVPKELPRRKGERHLAIRTEDHPMEYLDFTGSIPEGEYGGGQVRIFDRGTWELVGRTEDRLTFRLEGERLHGIWHLVHTGIKDRRDQWLAIMREDLRPPSEALPVAEPMRATPSDRAFDHPGWMFEPQWDGLRALAICGDETRLIARGSDVTAQYPELRDVHNRVVALDAMLDGVVVAFDDGVPSGERLQLRMEIQVDEGVRRVPVAYVVFDLLYLDGIDLTGRPLEERRRLLEELIIPSDKVVLSPATVGEGVALLTAVTAQGMDGIVAKRLGSTYASGAESPDWLVVTASD